jgi:MFS family permease
VRFEASKRDLIWAAVVGGLTFAVFVATLRPDVGGPEDSPKFQFVGHVLGTAHAPGYPFYTLLTSLFGNLPIANLAYRINLFSAVMGALACSGAFALSRQLGASRQAALAAALALATGAAFWHNAIVAEVYTLAAALVVVVSAALINWGRTRQRRHLYSACAWFAAGLGNHLTIVGMLPAALIYGIARDRSVLSPRVIGVAAVIGVLGLAQYGYIALRTFQHAPHLEARATSLSDVADIMVVRHQADVRFQYTLRTIVTERVGLLAAALHDEMGTFGVALLAIGIGYGFWRRQAEVALVVGASLGMLAIIINLYGDIPGFITPVVALLWPLAALGIEGVRSWLARFGGWMASAVTVAALALPVANVVANRRAIDEYRRVDDVQAYRALYSRLPLHATVLVEDFWASNVMKYLHFSGEYSPDPDPQLIPRDLESVRRLVAARTPVFAFGPSTSWMQAVGLMFKPVEVEGEAVESWLRRLPRGTLVAIAASGRALPTEWLPSGALGAIGRPKSYGTLAWTIGEPPIQLDQSDSASKAEIFQPAGRPRLQLTANQDGATIASGGDTLVIADAGLAMVTIAPDGGVDRRFRFAPDAPTTLPLAPAVFTFDREVPCAVLPAGRSTDITEVVSAGGWLTTMSESGRSIVRVEFAERQSRLVQTRLLDGRGSIAVESSSAERSKVILERTGVSRPVFAAVIPEATTGVTAELESGGAVDELRVCAMSPRPVLRPGATSGTIEVGTAANDNFGAGWHDAERAGSLAFRWSERVSTFLFPLEAAGPLDIRLLLRPASAEGATIEARMADQKAASCELAPGWAECRLRIAGPLTREGVNRLVLTSSTWVAPDARRTGDPRELAFALEGGIVRAVR